MSGVEIEEEHHISRYCKPSVIDNGLPATEAFLLRSGEEYLSVNWLEYFGMPDLAQAINCVRQVFLDKGYDIKVGGRFVSLQVNKVKKVISGYSHLSVRIIHKPSKDDPSHCGVFGFSGHASTDELIALKIARLAHAEDMHQGKLPS